MTAVKMLFAGYSLASFVDVEFDVNIDRCSGVILICNY